MFYIREFKDDYAFLSNFYDCPVRYKGRTFKSSEAAFQAEKCANDLDKNKYMDITPAAAKKLGRKETLRSDWEDIKEHVMYQIVLAKFEQNQDLATKLIQTGTAYLIEGNYWKDQFWGICPASGTLGVDGLNILGQILMRIRAKLRYDCAESKLKGSDFTWQ